ncbi:PDZ domain-containing protein [Rubritalea spongiae]|uniref:PDZ domain-containing protein n=1 Tax=Rubritalea spongiae TaxID=430797 RepID=A0ABW5E579_9BACT
MKVALCAMMACTQLFCVAAEQKQLIEQLGAESFEVRQRAYDELKAWALNNEKHSMSLLYDALQQPLTPEVNMRLDQILREIVLVEQFGRPQGFIGIELGSLLIAIDGEQVPAVMVNRVIPESAAAKEGLKAGDIISSLEGKRMTEHELRNARMTAEAMFISRVGKKFKGDQLRLGIFRDGKEQEMVLTLGERPDYLPSSNPQPSEEMKEEYFEKWLREQKSAKAE